MEFATSPLPEICLSAGSDLVPEISISPAPEPEPVPEPFSPFSAQFDSSTDGEEGDGYRATLLTPPPTVSPRFHRQPSPLRPPETTAKGLEQERFQALLAATRERNASGTGKKGPDLRKEIALKVHKGKQMERRAVFLSKLQAPPSPSATMLPKTPPESPAVFHYSLPSPGLVSPLALYEQMGYQYVADGMSWPPADPWVEQVDFRVPQDKCRKSPSTPTRPTTPSLGAHKRPPTLDQITARLTAQKQAAKDENGPRRAPLPAFLRKQEVLRPSNGVSTTRPGLKAPPAALNLPPVSPRSPLTPDLEIKTTFVPRSATKKSPTELNESNLSSLDPRGRKGHAMVSMLKRRMLSADGSEHGTNGHEEMDKKAKRHSAPAEMVKRERCGFRHPVLAMPGGF
ncbi:hypothetical protein EWM64_g3591 [Hericium alpestre]|uniref:Uncharacterized protein n=1 Tax=Hericium alpestre TaxID=135208 RepID=A0A4Z0A292_9AGAM|nr:hypothetical protein EWM64_g3591 [Hericium alpestre]